MSRLLLFNKPFNVTCQFRAVAGQQTLADFISVPSVYPAGRLDRDSEGLVLLTDDGRLQARITEPRFKLDKTYWVQVEGIASPAAIDRLAMGVALKDGMTARARVTTMDEPGLPRRTPPVRVRKNIPTSWLEIVLTEGRNRQVRRMTAAVGLPTLRLYRHRIGSWHLIDIPVGEFRELSVHMPGG